jgi:ABC-type polysaccharide/polyol phosphate transport system ATPase subunit
MAAAIEIKNVHKAFRIPHERLTTLTERILSLFRPVSYERFEALRGVDLTVEHGSFVGIIGGNGSGKSTLLKIASGLLIPDAGTVRVDGSMSALLELGLGFSPELTVRENVELYAAVLGYPRREVARRVEEAIDFADLERFRDAKLKNLSTGMRARLGFATALQAESDIMLLDEILAVGDANFQRKCLGGFEEFRRRRRTMLLVTHDLSQVQRFCDEAVLLQGGRIAERGDPDLVIGCYLKSVGQLTETMPQDTHGQRGGDGRVRILRAEVQDGDGRVIGRLRCGESATLVILFRAEDDVDYPVLGWALSGEDGTTVYSLNTHWLGQRTARLRNGQILELRAPFVANLPNGRYRARSGAMDENMTTFHDALDGIADFVIYGSACRHGFADLQGELHHRVVEDGVDPGHEEADQSRSTRVS